MQHSRLSDDEFRVLAYIRAYADHCDQHLDPTWVQEQLELSLSQMQNAGRTLADRGLAEFFEFDPPAELLRAHPQLKPGPMPCDIRLTRTGWNYLHKESGTSTP